MDINHFNNFDFYDSLVWSQKYFGTSKVFTIPDNLHTYLMIQTGSKFVHGILSFFATDATKLEIFAVPDATAGTNVPINNFFLASPTIPLTTLSLNPTVTSEGLLKSEYLVPAGGKGSVGASNAVPRHLILPPNLKILMKFTDISTGPSGLLQAQLQINFYETFGPNFDRTVD